MTFPALILAAVAASSPLTVHHVMRADGDRIICTGATPLEIEEIEFRSQQRKLRREGVSYVLDTYRERDITVDFDGDFPEEAKNAVIAAANIWDSHLLIEVPIEIEATYFEPEEDDTSSWLARASVTFTQSSNGYWAPRSLANQMTGYDKSRGDPEFSIEIKSQDNWHFGVDANVPDTGIDLVSVVLHEIGHALGITSSFYKPEDFDEDDPSLGLSGRSIIFDWFLWTWAQGWLGNEEEVPNPSHELWEAATGHYLFWGGNGWTSPRGEPLRSVKAHGGSIMLWAPSEFTASSVSHLHPYAYPTAVMTPAAVYGRRKTIHPVTLGMLYDMGWELKERAVDPLDVLRCLEGR